jgi:hypothetical protein
LSGGLGRWTWSVCKRLVSRQVSWCPPYGTFVHEAVLSLITYNASTEPHLVCFMLWLGNAAALLWDLMVPG